MHLKDEHCPNLHVVHIWVGSQNNQLTDFDHCSYLPSTAKVGRLKGHAETQSFC